MIASAQFKTPSNSYKLEIESSSITANETLTLSGSQPVKICYQQADLKFSGLRTVTAIINIIADKDMSYLYATSATGTACRIYKQEGGSWMPIFIGFLKPFVYRAPFTGIGDNVEIEAVDALSAYKYTNYKIEGNVSQFKQSALDWIIDTMTTAGIYKLCAHANFGKKTSSTIGHNLERLSIPSQAWLPKDFLNDAPNVALTEIINDIAQFFGYTAVLWGDTLYMYDTAALPIMGYHTHCTMYTVDPLTGDVTTTDQTGTTTALSADKTILASSFEASDTLMTVEQGYSKVKLRQRDAETATFLPDLLHDDDSVAEHGDRIQSGYGGNNTGADIYVQRAILSTASIFTKIFDANSGVEMTVSDFVNDPSLLSPGRDIQVEWTGALPIRVMSYSIGNNYNGTTTAKYIWVRNKGVYASLGMQKLFSIFNKAKGYFTGKRIRISGRVWRRTDNSELDFIPPFYGSLGYTGATDTVSLYVKSGNKYYAAKASTQAAPQPNQTQWQTASAKAPMRYGSSGSTGGKSIQTSAYAFSQFDTGWIDVSQEGSIDLYYEINADSQEGSPDLNMWFEDLIVEAAGDGPTEDECTVILTNGDEELEQSFGLIYGYYPQKRIVLGSSFEYAWARQSDSGTTTIPLAGVLNKQVSRYKQKQTAYQLTIGEDVQPWSLCTFLSKSLTVDAMDWDLMAETKTVVID